MKIYHPYSMPSGAATVVDKEQMDHLLDRLQNGDPTKGWEGDPFFALAYHRPTQTWELWRQEDDRQYRLTARSRPGMLFPQNIIEELVKHDTRRGFNAERHVNEHNTKVSQKRDRERTERLGPAYEKLFWALRKDDNTGAGI